MYGEYVSDEKYGEYYNKYSKDINFLQILCWGPWRKERAEDVENKMHEYIQKSKIKWLTDINENNYGRLYPFKWQRQRALSLAKFLKQKSKTFDNFLSALEINYRDNGMKIVEELGKATNEGSLLNNHKIISVFVRDVMKKDAFPLDSRVKEMLGSLGLPSDEKLIINLCRRNEIDPRILNRMMWLHNGGNEKYPGYCNNECKNGEKECPIKNECYKWILKVV